MFQSMMNSPEIMQNLIQSNPQLRQMMDANPHVAQMLNDPELMRQSMELARNPALMREMMRNSDRAIANIENNPLGFQALRNMYHTVQEPLYEAAIEQNAALMGESERPPTVSAQSANSDPNPNAAPLPNPWASAQSTPNPQSNPSNNGASTAVPNPFQSPFGNLSPELMRSMDNNPFFQQMTESLLQNPQLLASMIQNNPMLSQMTQNNPMLQQVYFIFGSYLSCILIGFTESSTISIYDPVI
jgi:ubiquilin